MCNDVYMYMKYTNVCHSTFSNDISWLCWDHCCVSKFCVPACVEVKCPSSAPRKGLRWLHVEQTSNDLWAQGSRTDPLLQESVCRAFQKDCSLNLIPNLKQSIGVLSNKEHLTTLSKEDLHYTLQTFNDYSIYIYTSIYQKSFKTQLLALLLLHSWFKFGKRWHAFASPAFSGLYPEKGQTFDSTPCMTASEWDQQQLEIWTSCSCLSNLNFKTVFWWQTNWSCSHHPSLLLISAEVCIVRPQHSAGSAWERSILSLCSVLNRACSVWRSATRRSYRMNASFWQLAVKMTLGKNTEPSHFWTLQTPSNRTLLWTSTSTYTQNLRKNLAAKIFTREPSASEIELGASPLNLHLEYLELSLQTLTSKPLEPPTGKLRPP